MGEELSIPRDPRTCSKSLQLRDVRLQQHITTIVILPNFASNKSIDRIIADLCVRESNPSLNLQQSSIEPAAHCYLYEPAERKSTRIQAVVYTRISHSKIKESNTKTRDGDKRALAQSKKIITSRETTPKIPQPFQARNPTIHLQSCHWHIPSPFLNIPDPDCSTTYRRLKNRSGVFCSLLSRTR